MKILLAVNLSEPESFTRQAIELARRMDAELLVLHVISPPPANASAGLEPMTLTGGAVPYAPYDPALSDHLERAEENAYHAFLTERFDEPVNAALRHGDPADGILEDAREQDVDLIVLGKHRHSRLERLFLGSVATSVVKHITHPTMLLPIGDKK